MHSILPHTSNPTLREKARVIDAREITSAHMQALIADMKALLAQEEYGVALAAPQVGEPLRLFVVSGKALEKRHARYFERPTEGMPHTDEVFINPAIIKMSRGKKEKHEGCLSVRGKWGLVPRAEKVTLRYFDEHGKEHERGASGLLAHIFQHEIDHLDGVLYIDKAKELYDDTEK